MNYEAQSWKGFLQQIVRLASAGYTWYSLTEMPVKKRDRWPDIDRKILARYEPLTLSKYQRARRKARGLANFQYLRWDRYALILGAGDLSRDRIAQQERFRSLHNSALLVQVSRAITLRVGLRAGSWTLFIEDNSYRSIRDWYIQSAKRGLDEVQDEFRGLDRFLPSWSGIYGQKRRLRDAVVKTARQSGHRWHTNDFPISNRKKSVKVFEGSKVSRDTFGQAQPQEAL